MSEGPPDLPLTRRESVVPPTQREGPAHPGGLLMLPDSLRGRWRIVGELPSGGEADVVLVESITGDGRQQVVKIYRPQVTIDTHAAGRLTTLDRTFLVAPFETGFDNGRHWELMEYVRGGSLVELAAAGAMAADRVAEIVRQLTEAVAELHRARITHSDLKPANVLVRRTDPLWLALSDFGLSKYLADASKRFTRLGNTVAYAAPESFAGRFSPAQDWWALGMIARELATGEPPFAGLTDRVVMHELMVHDVPLDAVSDGRLRLLCSGLLVRDPDHRWAEEQVRAWLRGETPHVHAGADVRGDRPLVVAGQECWTRAEAGRAFVDHWDDAQQTFLTHIGTREAPGEGWRLLRTWLEQFDHDVEQRARLVDQVLTAHVVPQVRMLHLLRWLDPSLPPVYRGLLLRPDQIPALAASAIAPGTGAEVVRDLWQHRLLELLAQFDGGADLTRIDRQWRNSVAQLESIRDAAPPTARRVLQDAASTQLAALLHAAADPAVPPTLTARANAARGRFHPPPSWFGALNRVQDPAVALAVITTAPVAEAEYRQMLAERDRPRQIWLAEEQRRADGRSRAFGLAAAAMAVWATILLVGVLVFGVGAPMVAGGPFGPGGAGGFTPDATEGTQTTAGGATTLLALFVLVWLANAGAEFALAGVLGGHYHPRWSTWTLLGKLWRRVPDAWDHARRAGNALRAAAAAAPLLAGICCCAACCFSGPILGIVSTVLAVVLLGAGAAHLIWSAVRFFQFYGVHSKRRSDLLGNGGHS